MTAIIGLPQRKRWRLEPRYQIVFACFLATFAAYVERVGFSIAFTAMAKEAALDESSKGTVLSAFFWGYAVSQIPGGWAAQRYGGRLMLIICFILWSSISVATPSNAKNVLGIIAARVCIGIAQGFLIPSVHTVLSQWIPPHERASMTSLVTSGMYLGSAAAMLVLPSLEHLAGPAFLLKIVGGMGFAWLGLWMTVGKEIPHRETVIPLTMTDVNGKGSGGASKGRPGPTPWKRMISHPAILAIVINNFSFHYGFYIIMNWLPTYFNNVFKVELASLGYVKTLPYLVMFLMSNVGGITGDRLIQRSKYSVAAARKTVNTLGFVASAGALMLMPAASGVWGGIAATTLTLGTFGFSRGGFSVNHMDIAPKYAGMVMGISNTAGTIAGTVGVFVTGCILDWNGGASVLGGWYQAHGLAAVICIFAMLVFNTFARGERQFD